MAPTKQASQKSRNKSITSKRKTAMSAAQNRWGKSRPKPDNILNKQKQPGHTHIPQDSTEAIPSTSSNCVEITVPQFKTRLSDLDTSVNQPDQNSDSNEDVPCYQVIDTNILKSLFTDLCCPLCNKPTVALNISNKMGFVSKLEITCSSCAEVIKNTSSSKSTDGFFDLNKRFVKHFISNGHGHSVMEKCCMVFNMNGLSNRSYQRYMSYMSKKTIDAGEINLDRARERVREGFTEN